jgi:hypothetical protein
VVKAVVRSAPFLKETAAMSASPSVSYSITVRLEAPSYGNAVNEKNEDV